MLRLALAACGSNKKSDTTSAGKSGDGTGAEGNAVDPTLPS